MYDFEREMKRCQIRDMIPFYVLDTSAIIDLCRSHKNDFVPFLKTLNGNGIITDLVWQEAESHAKVSIGYRREICEDVMHEIRRIASHNEPLTSRVAQHQSYDAYRFEALRVCNLACPEKKIEDDPISLTDRHVLATAMTLGAHPEEFLGKNSYPIVLASDAHIVDTMTALCDPEARHYAQSAYRDEGQKLAHALERTRIFEPRRY